MKISESVEIVNEAISKVIDREEEFLPGEYLKDIGINSNISNNLQEEIFNSLNEREISIDDFTINLQTTKTVGQLATLLVLTVNKPPGNSIPKQKAVYVCSQCDYTFVRRNKSVPVPKCPNDGTILTKRF